MPSARTGLLDGDRRNALTRADRHGARILLAAKNRSPQELAAETADLWYHSLVLLLDAGLQPEDVYRVLRDRHRQKTDSAEPEPGRRRVGAE